MSKLFWLVKLLSGRKSMKGILVASGIGAVVLLALFAWGAVAGIGFVWNNAPRWLEGGERLAAGVEAWQQEAASLSRLADAWLAGTSLNRPCR